jgi:CSLREA domain-containing protein
MSRHWRRSRLGLVLSIALPLTLVLGSAPSPASAQTARPAFVVNSTADAVDASPGDGLCRTAAGSCTLRAAVQETNALIGPDTIKLAASLYPLAIPPIDGPTSGEDLAARDDLDIADDLTINGAGLTSTTVDGASVDRVFHVVGSPTVQITGLTVQNGYTFVGSGGGIYSPAGKLTLTNVRMQNNQSPDHAGGALWTGGPATLKKVTLDGNRGRELGGGGVYVAPSGSLTLQDSKVTNNSGLAGGGVAACGPTTIVRTVFQGNRAMEGAAIFTCEGVVLKVTNSTVSGNTASSQGVLWLNGPSTFTNATIAYNAGTSAGGGVWVSAVGSARMTNTLLAHNTPDNCAGVRPTLIGTGHNLDSGSTCGFPSNGNNWSNNDPKLGPLADNGGNTLTHGFVAASSAIDSGDGGTCPAVDQRNSPRPVDGNGNGSALCDIGAYEQQTALRW